LVLSSGNGKIPGKSKIAGHGGFAEDDTHVLLVVSNPKLHGKVVNDRVENKQVAPTILKALGLEPEQFEAVRGEELLACCRALV
jgi:arylsulfatase A-like enzyme